MSSDGFLDDLAVIPIPVIIVTAAALIRYVAASGTSLDPRPRWRKWPIYAAIVWGAGLSCGLYIDILTAFRYGWPHDWLAGFIATFVCLIFATIAMPVMIALWGASLLLKRLFPNLRSNGTGDDWDIPDF